MTTTNDLPTADNTMTDYSWLSNDDDSSSIDCLCLGTGRFLRSVLVPALVGASHKTALIQTRGRTFLEYMLNRDSSSFEVDTVMESGAVETTYVPCQGVFTLGSEQGKEEAFQFIPQMKRISIIGVGVTEAGLASKDTQGMQSLYRILTLLKDQLDLGSLTCPNPNGRICIVNTDNVPSNGSVIQKHMMELALSSDEEMLRFLKNRVVFLNSMVDRITSQREGSGGTVPRCEPMPHKALVVLDQEGDLPQNWHNMRETHGVVVRCTSPQLQQDIALKLRIANGTHTAVAHVMALTGMLKTSVLSTTLLGKLLLEYLDSLFPQIYKGAVCAGFEDAEIRDAYKDWRRRLCHAHFGLSSFFITQSGPAKGGIRLGPTIKDLIQSSQEISVALVYSWAALLRWLTPLSNSNKGVYRGWLDGADRQAVSKGTIDSDAGVEYADGMRYDLDEGWYEFRCACEVSVDDAPLRPLSDCLGDYEMSHQPQAYVNVIRAYLTKSDGGNLQEVATNPKTKKQFVQFTTAVATLYARMVAGDGMLDLLQEMAEKQGVYGQGFETDCRVLEDSPSLENGRPLHYRVTPIPDDSKLLKASVGIDTVTSVVVSEVASALVIDLHTHLLPPSHGALCLWGIDELLTYHYLVAEYFMTAPASVSPEDFFALTKRQQADMIWKALFIDRSPVSEACRGVITTLQALGLSKEVADRDLEGVRNYYNAFRDAGLDGTERFSEIVYTLSGVRYAIMTNIPFDSNEAQYWRPKKKEYPDRYRSALRVDPLLAGDRNTVEAALKASGYEVTLEGARQYLRDWCDTMKPEYMMASTPHDFVLKEGPLSGISKTGVNEDAMKEPFAFVDVSNKGSGVECAIACDGDEDATATVIDENSDFLPDVLMKVCEERDLPVALKIGAHRGVNPELHNAGDGVVAFADAGVLARLCSRFPKVRFLATFLSRNNQHEACVLATKFRNLHIYGCWWFCNNPSMIRDITQMRVEMLGTAFTAQHSDARVLDQLIYKWSHSRAVIAGVLAAEYAKLSESGWTTTRGEIRRDVQRLFGGSYDEFMHKSFT